MEYKEEHRRSLDNPEAFWAEQARALHWDHPWHKVLDSSTAPLHRWVDAPHDGDTKSFAPVRRGGNDVKWHVDGCGYMYAVSVALERARQSVWIMDWWLSPELYLRRPPAKNEEYRLDRMLKAAAERGVKVHVIVYKEVSC